MRSATWVLAGALGSMLAALFQHGRVSIHPQCSHNNLFHVGQMGAMYLLYRGGLLLREREPEAPDFDATQPLPIAGEE
jgi:threonine/homoserine/homoserine lactone efflux protein